MGNVKEEYLRRDLANITERAANAELRAAEANKKAEEERLARVKLEVRLAPRSLTSEQLNNLAEHIKPYKGVSIDILQYGETTEISHLRFLLNKLLIEAGWNPRAWIVVGDGPVLGVIVGVRNNANDIEKRASTILAAALQSEGIITSLEQVFTIAWPGFVSGPPYDVSKEAPIRMLIGTKP